MDESRGCPGISIHPRHLQERLSRPPVDLPAVFGLRQRRGDQPALQVPAGERLDRACRSRSICRRSAAMIPTTSWRWARSARSASRCSAWRKRKPSSRASTCQGLDLVHHQRHRGDHLRHVRGARRQDRRAARRAHRHDPERYPQGICRARNLDLPGPPLDAADRRHRSCSRTSRRPRFNPISIAGAHVRDAGCDRRRGDGLYPGQRPRLCRRTAAPRGGDANSFAKRLSFFFYVHMDFFEEVAKFRAGRRLWAKLLKERYGVTDPKALMFRFGVVCGGSSLTGVQPYNNIVPRRDRDDGGGDGRRAVDLHLRL